MELNYLCAIQNNNYNVYIITYLKEIELNTPNVEFKF